MIILLVSIEKHKISYQQGVSYPAFLASRNTAFIPYKIEIFFIWL